MKKSMQELGFQQLYGPELQNIPPPEGTLAEKFLTAIEKTRSGSMPDLDYSKIERRLSMKCAADFENITLKEWASNILDQQPIFTVKGVKCPSCGAEVYVELESLVDFWADAGTATVEEAK